MMAKEIMRHVSNDNPWWMLRSAMLVGLAVFATLGLGGCGDDDANDTTNNAIAEGTAGRLTASPTSVVFDQVAVGGASTKTITLVNSGQGVLRIRSMELTEEAGDGAPYDGLREFRKGQRGWTADELTIQPGQTHELTVRYEPKEQTPDEGAVVLHSNDPRNGGELRISLDSQDLAAEISSAPAINFQRVPVREDPDWPGAFKLLTVQNTGAAPLVIDSVYVNGSERFSLSYPTDAQAGPDQDRPDPPAVLAPNESFTVRVRFRPDDNRPESADLIFETNDPDEPQYGVLLRANSGAPCIQVSPAETVDFGQGSLGQVSRKVVTIENCSRSEQLVVDAISVSDDAGGAFGLDQASLPDQLPAGPASVDSGERTNVVVTFEPDAERQYEGELTIRSNDDVNDQIQVPIRGRGSDNQCPTARASAHLAESSRQETDIETIPLKTVEFDGMASTDDDGSVERYEWTILSRPQGSTQRFLPNNGEAQPELFVDLAGTYEIELTVYDDQGAASCGQPALITIDATPDHDVHIQLVWDTPSDRDQTDDFGSDLDLHYLNDQGRWDNPPWDIFWHNITADWGTPGDADDPSLDIDDTNGAGPENINHNGLQNRTYRVGVYYFNDRALGASYATVRVYVGGELELELENTYMPETGSFWDVGRIAWPSGNVTNISRMYRGFP